MITVLNSASMLTEMSVTCLVAVNRDKILDDFIPQFVWARISLLRTCPVLEKHIVLETAAFCWFTKSQIVNARRFFGCRRKKKDYSLITVHADRA